MSVLPEEYVQWWREAKAEPPTSVTEFSSVREAVLTEKILSYQCPVTLPCV